MVLDYTFTSFLNYCKTYCNSEANLPPLCLNENEVFARLAQARENVHEALCDDFNTPKVIVEINELVSHMNRLFQSQATVQATDSNTQVQNRHLGCIMSVSNFVQDILDTLGFVSDQKPESSGSSGGVKMDQVIEASIKLRKNVRKIALDKTTPKETKTNILKLCDELRTDFQKANIELKDSKENTIWQIRSDQK